MKNNDLKKNPKKVVYEVRGNETLDECLNRIKKDGYVPVKRTEKPVFQEIKDGNQTKYEPNGRQIIFEAKKVE